MAYSGNMQDKTWSSSVEDTTLPLGFHIQ